METSGQSSLISNSDVDKPVLCNSMILMNLDEFSYTSYPRFPYARSKSRLHDACPGIIWMFNTKQSSTQNGKASNKEVPQQSSERPMLAISSH